MHKRTISKNFNIYFNTFLTCQHLIFYRRLNFKVLTINILAMLSDYKMPVLHVILTRTTRLPQPDTYVI